MDKNILSDFAKEADNLKEMRCEFYKEIEKLKLEIDTLNKGKFLEENDAEKIIENNELKKKQNEELIKQNQILIDKNNLMMNKNTEILNKNNLLLQKKKENIEKFKNKIKEKKELIEENEKLIIENERYLEELKQKNDNRNIKEDKKSEIIIKNEEIALELKKQGALFFNNKSFLNAIDKFEEALIHTPEENITLITILNSNIGICLMRLDKFSEAIVYLNLCLAQNPNFVKAQVNRAECNFQLKKYDPCLNDYEDLLKKNAKFVNLSKYNEIKRLQKEEFDTKKDEVMGQMKDLGNKFLGMFGMSVDNFQLNQGQNGGYNISFQQ